MTALPDSALPADLPYVLELLTAAGLPTGGLQDQFPGGYVVIRDDHGLAAVGGVERYGDTGLLRSVVVHPRHRGRGLGRVLVRRLLQASHDLEAVYLLTTTAADVFRHLGFTDTDRLVAPVTLRASPEFASICPSDATCLAWRNPSPRSPAVAKVVLFACVHNAGRSQMAAAFFDALADPSKARSLSAGTAPGPHVHPEVLAAMREVGLDLSGRFPGLLSPALADQATLLVTMGCGEACPAITGLRREDWPLDDPKGQPTAQVRRIRDQIEGKVRHLLEREGWAST